MKKFIAGLVIGLLIATAGISFASNETIRIFVNNQEVVTDVSPQIIDGRVMVPARFIAEPLGATVEWDAVNSTVIITSRDYASAVAPDTKTNDDWMDIRNIVEKYKVSAGQTSDNGFEIKGNVALLFYPPKSYDIERKTYQLDSNLGKINLLIDNHRYYLQPSELKDLGVVD